MIGQTEAELLGKDDQAPMAWVDAPTFYPETHTKGHDTLNSEDREIVKWMLPRKYYAFNKRKNKLAVGFVDGSICTYFILHKNRRRYYIPQEIDDHYDLK